MYEIYTACASSCVFLARSPRVEHWHVTCPRNAACWACWTRATYRLHDTIRGVRSGVCVRSCSPPAHKPIGLHGATWYLLVCRFCAVIHIPKWRIISLPVVQGICNVARICNRCFYIRGRRIFFARCCQNPVKCVPSRRFASRFRNL